MSPTTTHKLTGDTFHNLSIEKAFKTLNTALDSNRISKRDYDLISEYINLKRGCSQITISRIRKLVYHLTTWRKYIGEYESNTIGDLARGILVLENSKTVKGTEFSPETLSDYIHIIKQFYKWLIDEGLLISLKNR
ncbi:site-specific recombinase XerD [Methanomicrobium sp. W14]|uniref:hypothetical protein n=1 Tax=Methanomicrobium sp. W14 TaxID=2817839 RepID=UPI001AE88AC9|nr:hypothetical protein [Methanomicrobium sp. W14]MBP2132622.1 site-specific recombinase XerD [Methanomicrobium sp. W14]